MTEATPDTVTQAEQHANVLKRLLLAAKLLQDNAVGCAQEHHGHDFQEQGMPGWLADTHEDIFKAEAVIERLAHQPDAQAIRDAALDEAMEIVFDEVGNHTVSSRINRRIEALKASPPADPCARLVEALEELREAYLCEADPYSIAGFHRKLEEDDAIVACDEALAAHRERRA